MTVGIGGWGSRRKPMALVRALCRSSAKDLRDRLLRRSRRRLVVPGGQGARGRVRVRVARLDRARAALPQRSPVGLGHHDGARRRHVPAGPAGRGVARPVPADARRSRFRRDALQPRPADDPSPYADGEEFVAMPALQLDVALIHMHRGDQGGTGQYLNVDPYFDDLMCMAAKRRFMSVEEDRRDRAVPRRRTAAVDPHQSAHDRRRRRNAARRALHRVRARLSARRGVPEGVYRFGEIRRGVGRVPRPLHRRDRSRVPAGGFA